MKKRQECKEILTKGNIYKQMYKWQRVRKANIKARNRRVITKFFKTICFVVKKNWAVRENFESIIAFLQNDIGDTDINAHLKDCSSRATCTSVALVDQFLKCLDEILDKEMWSRVIAAIDYSLLADETTDMADRAVLSVFIRYVNSDTHKVKEEYLGLVEIIRSKDADALCQKVCYLLHSKDIIIKQLRFHGLDSTNAISGQHTGLQRKLKH